MNEACGHVGLSRATQSTSASRHSISVLCAHMSTDGPTGEKAVQWVHGLRNPSLRCKEWRGLIRRRRRQHRCQLHGGAIVASDALGAEKLKGDYDAAICAHVSRPTGNGNALSARASERQREIITGGTRTLKPKQHKALAAQCSHNVGAQVRLQTRAFFAARRKGR